MSFSVSCRNIHLQICYHLWYSFKPFKLVVFVIGMMACVCGCVCITKPMLLSKQCLLNSQTFIALRSIHIFFFFFSLTAASPVGSWGLGWGCLEPILAAHCSYRRRQNTPLYNSLQGPFWALGGSALCSRVPWYCSEGVLAPPLLTILSNQLTSYYCHI